jgi:excisionase family DNA binding protein
MSEQREVRWLTVEDVATQLQVSQETVRRWIRSGRLPVLDLGGPKAGYRIREDALEAFVAERYGPIAKTAA